MEVQYRKEYSPALGRDMECKIYGHKGRPVLFIPCQDGRFFDFENFHMTDTWSPWLEAGEVMVFSIDTIDQETWSDTDGDPYWRIRRYEQWLQYITDEMVPFMREIVNGFGSCTDEVVRRNSLVDFLGDMPKDDPRIALYNLKKAVICVGQGPWELPDSTRQLAQILAEKDIHAWVDFWGYDCSHDWYWWYKQVEYFVPYLLKND